MQIGNENRMPKEMPAGRFLQLYLLLISEGSLYFLERLADINGWLYKSIQLYLNSNLII